MGYYLKIWVYYCRLKISVQMGVAIKLKPVTVSQGILLMKQCQKTYCNCYQIEYFHQFSKYVKCYRLRKLTVCRSGTSNCKYFETTYSENKWRSIPKKWKDSRVKKMFNLPSLNFKKDGFNNKICFLFKKKQHFFKHCLHNISEFLLTMYNLSWVAL